MIAMTTTSTTPATAQTPPPEALQQIPMLAHDPLSLLPAP